MKDLTAGYAKDHLIEHFLKQQLWKPTGLVKEFCIMILVYHKKVLKMKGTSAANIQ